jgi:hypothetical protein
MLVPSCLLAIGAIITGILFKETFTGSDTQFWNNSILFLQTIQHDHPPTWLLVITPLIVIIAIPTAYYLFVENEKILKNFVLKNQTLYNFLVNKWYFDDFYNFIFIGDGVEYKYFNSQVQYDSIKPTPTVLQQKQNKTKEEFEKNLPARNPKTNDTSTTLEKTELPSKPSVIDPKVTSKKPSNSLPTNPIAAFGNSSAMVKDEDTEEKLKLHADETPTVSTENDIPLKLTIKVKDDVWFNIAVDDSPVEDLVLARGSDKIFHGKKQYLLNVGNQNAVDLTLNGAVVNLPSGNKENIVKNFTITSGSLLIE